MGWCRGIPQGHSLDEVPIPSPPREPCLSFPMRHPDGEVRWLSGGQGQGQGAEGAVPERAPTERCKYRYSWETQRAKLGTPQ